MGVISADVRVLVGGCWLLVLVSNTLNLNAYIEPCLIESVYNDYRRIREPNEIVKTLSNSHEPS